MHSATVAFVVFVAAVAQQVVSAHSGIRVSGTSIVDGNGVPFIMRGINQPHTWFKKDAEVAIPAIAATGANVVRIVLSNGDLYYKDDAESVMHLIDLCRKNKMVVIIDVHDTIGSDDEKLLESAADYWVSLAPLLQGTEDFVIINIANEWISTLGKSAQWAAGYRSVIPRMRAAGLKHLFIVDCSGYGQDAASINEAGRSIFESDPLRNTAFSIHMYEYAGAYAAFIKQNIDNSLAIGVPVIIGEFSYTQNGLPVDYKYLMEYCAERGVGWLAWTWYGHYAPVECFDLATGPSGEELLPIGKEIVDGELGIRKNAKPVTTW